MRRAVSRFVKDNEKATFILQLTAMVDMFTILIVFLLKSFSTSAIHITPHKGLKIPFSTSQGMPIEALRLVVSKDGIYVDDKLILKLNDGKVNKIDLDKSDKDFIRPLFDELDKLASKYSNLGERLSDEVKEGEAADELVPEFKGDIVMQADSKLHYRLLKKVMYTSSMAGYAGLRLATLSD